jgi:hypothetical protein
MAALSAAGINVVNSPAGIGEAVQTVLNSGK